MVNRKHKLFHLMGREIGMATGWDSIDSYSIIIYDVQPNSFLLRFVPDFKGGDLCVDWERGEVYSVEDSGAETFLVTDWSVFNRTKSEPGWEPPKEVDPNIPKGKKEATPTWQ